MLFCHTEKESVSCS